MCIWNENEWLHLDDPKQKRINNGSDTETIIIRKDLFYKTLSRPSLKVVKIILESFFEYGSEFRLTKVRENLRKMGWTHTSIRKSFQEIRKYLKETKW